MSRWLQDKRIVIIGGTTGIGLAAAQAVVKEGASVVVLGKDEDTTALAVKTIGDHCIGLTADATNPASSLLAIKHSVRSFGGFDSLFHVAGGSGRRWGDGPLDELTLEGWNQTFNLNLTSLMLSNQAAIRTFIEYNTSGAILNLGSILGYSPSPRHFATHAYAAAKSAIIGFSKSTASYYASQDIRINVLAPSLVDTPMANRAANDPVIQAFIKTKQPLDGGRMARPSDLIGAVVYFLSDYSRFTTGQVLAVDGGWSVSEGQY